MSEIDHYLRRLDAALTGPRRLKADLMREVRDGLEDAAEGYGGRPDRAIAEFGDVPDVAPAYQAELAASATRSLALRIAAAFGAGAFASHLMWSGGSWAGAAPPAGFQVLSDVIDWSGNGLAVAGALTAIAIGRSGHLPMTALRRLNRAFALLLAVAWTVGGALYVWSVALWPDARSWPPMIVGGLAITAASAWIAHATHAGVRATRVSPVVRPETARPSS